MLDTVSKLIESISLAWWALIVPHFWDIAFLALILWCIDLVLRKASATWRYALWCVLLAKILLPFETSSPFSITDNLTRSFDPLSLFVSSPSSESNPGQGEYFAPNLDIQQMHGGSPPPQKSHISSPAARRVPAKGFRLSQISIPILFILWLGGVVAVLYASYARLQFLQNLMRLAKPNEDPDIQATYSAIAKDIGLRTIPPLYIGNYIGSPLVCGLWRSTVLVPASLLPLLSVTQLKPVLAHELAHVARFDSWAIKLQFIARLLLFWHPGFWLAERRLHRYREESCDDMALALLDTAQRGYADSILNVIEFCSPSAIPNLSFFTVMESRRLMERRLERIMTPRKLVTRLSTSGFAIILLIASAILPATASRDWLQSDPPPTRVSFVSGQTSSRLPPPQGGDNLPLQVLKGHTEPILSIACSPDGARVLTGSRDYSARLWNLADGQLLWNYSDHPREVSSVCFSPDERSVLTGCRDGVARLWDCETGALQSVFFLPGATGRIQAVGFFGDEANVLVSGNWLGEGGRTHLWDRDGETYETLVHDAHVSAAAISSRREEILVGTDTGIPELWSLRERRRTLTFKGHSDEVNCVAFLEGDVSVVTGSGDGTAKLWDRQTGEVLHTFEHVDPVTSLAAFPDGTKILTGTGGGTARVWDARTGDILWSFQHPGEVTSVAVSPDGSTILSGCEDSVVRIWNLARLSTNPEI